MDKQQMIPGCEPMVPVREDVPVREIQEGLPDAPASLRKSMETYGQMQPVILRLDPVTGTYLVVDGRRRVSAARALAWEEVSALIVEAGESMTAAMSITANAARADNPLSDLDSIERLLNDGLSQKDIAARTGMSVGTIRKRLKLANLPVDIRMGVEAGAVAVGVAEAVASLPASQQSRLVSVLREEGKITRQDVSKVAEIDVQASLEGLDDALFSTPSADTSSQVSSLSDAIRAVCATYQGSVTYDEWIALCEEAWEACHG